MAYDFRNRTWCSGSNTAPSRSERDEALENGRRFRCQECGRAVSLTKNGLVPTHLAHAKTQAKAPERKPGYAQEVMLRVSWSVLSHPDGQPQHARRGEVMLDLGLEQAPDPELTNDEMQQVAFAAKMAALKALGRRPKPQRSDPMVPMKSVKMWIGNLDGDRAGLVIAPSKEQARKIVGTSRADFDNHWVMQRGVYQGLEFEVLYTRVGNNDLWQQGRCQLGATS